MEPRTAYTSVYLADGLAQVVRISEPGGEDRLAVGEPVGLPLTEACFPRDEFLCN